MSTLSNSVIAELEAKSSAQQADEVSQFLNSDQNSWAQDNRILGVISRRIFPIAKQFHQEANIDDIETLLENPHFEVRMAAMAIMDFQAQKRRTETSPHPDLFDLYLRRHDRINNSELVDRAARRVVGEQLLHSSREILDELAASANPWKRRTAIVSTYAFIRLGDTEDIFRISAALIADPHPMVQKAIASWVREASKHNPSGLIALLEENHQRMDQTTLRTATSTLDQSTRRSYLSH